MTKLQFVIGAVASAGPLLADKVLAAYQLAVPQGGIFHDRRGSRLIPMFGASIVMVVLLIFFREPAKLAESAAGGPTKW